MKPGYSKQLNSHEIFAQWSTNPSLKLEMARLNKIYTFRVKNMGYNVEFLEMWHPFQTKLPFWGMTVRHREWSTHLSELERLPQGRAVDFGDIVETFLPQNGVTSADEKEGDHDLPQLHRLGLDEDSSPPARDGIRKLVNLLLTLSRLINE